MEPTVPPDASLDFEGKDIEKVGVTKGCGKRIRGDDEAETNSDRPRRRLNALIFDGL